MAAWAFVALGAVAWSRGGQWTELSITGQYWSEGHAMAYDSRRDVVVLFGGCYPPFSCYNDTLEFTGGWGYGPAAPAALRPRAYLGMAFDSVRGVTVLYGGRDAVGGGAPFDDTWEYDGIAWTPGPAGPGARYSHALAFDSVRGVMVLFGGETSSAVRLDDTWEYDGTAWRPGPLAPLGLTPRSRFGMAFDATRGRVVLFSGAGAPGPDTWEYDGSSWLPGAGAPAGLTGRAGHALAFDAWIQRCVLFGGDAGVGGTTWEYDGSSWTRSATTGPWERTSHAMAYHGASGGIILFGGTDGIWHAQDTWLYVGTICSAIALHPPTLPDGTEGRAYSQTITASGGRAPYTYAVTAGSLPPGLALNSSLGRLAGTPAAPGASAFTITATDADGCRGSLWYAITIHPAMDYVLGEGLGAGANTNRVRVFKPDDTPVAGVDFQAYAAASWGTNVSSADVDGGTYSEILTGPGPGGSHGPQVRAFDRNGQPIPKVNFFAYGALRYGVNVAGGDLDRDGFGEILSGPGPGAVFGPHVRGWSFDATAVTSMAKVSFFAYGTLAWGVNVEEGDVDGDVWPEILTGPGPGAVFAANVRGFDYDGATLAAIGKVAFVAHPNGHGVNVAGGDVDADGYDEIATTPGPGPANGSNFRGWQYDGTAISASAGFVVTPWRLTAYGGRVNLADIDADGSSDLLAGHGRDPLASSEAYRYRYDGATLTRTGVVVPFTTAGYGFGVNVAGCALGHF